MEACLLLLLFILCIVCNANAVEPPQPKRRNRNKPSEPPTKPLSGETVSDPSFGDLYPTFIPNVGKIPTTSNYRSLSDCPPCWASKRNMVQVAIDSYWQNDLSAAFACACNQLQSNPEDGHAQAIIYALTQGKHAPYSVASKVLPPSRAAPPIKRWEILGPFNVGKLEHDADPTFQQRKAQEQIDNGSFDPIQFVLGMFYNGSVSSDLGAEGKVKWSAAKPNDLGEVDVRFPAVKWNEVIQSVSSMAAYEFQAWARSVSYIKTPGSYVVSCAGPHSVYVRNDNATHVVIGDVYRSGMISGSLDLRIGLVGIAVPLRGMGQTSFQCHLEPAANSIAVQPPQSVPDLLEFPEVPNRGYLLTSAFALPVQNLLSSSLTVEFTVEKPMGQEGEYFVREARPLQQRREDDDADPGYVGELSVAPGQTMLLSLELLPVMTNTLPFISCRKKMFTINVIPSRGNPVKVGLEFKCRKVDQSFTVSYLDHDNSVAQAAVVFPLEYHNDHFRSEVPQSTTSVDVGAEGDELVSDGPAAKSYPVLLSTHGSGIAASSHADAHKMIPAGMTDYVFGVEGFIVLAPSRFGAHNWEATGELSARQALMSLKTILHRSLSLRLTPKAANKVAAARSMLPLPQVRIGSGIASGHSMGAHGAWMLAVNSPDLFTCLAPLSGWINKEQYGTANAFFHLDSSSSYVEPQLKELLESAMSDTHVDKLMHNVQGMDVHIRVGSADGTTHPWYSRRTHRLLEQLHVNSTYEEVSGKEHWWWDSSSSNDGGVINDPRMRAFYAHCREKAATELMQVEEVNAHIDEPSDVKVSSVPVSVLGWSPAAKEFAAPPAIQQDKFRRPCGRNITLTVVNPAASAGLCGLQILQQRRMMSRASVGLHCTQPAPSKPLRSRAVQAPLEPAKCTLTARNVQKLTLKFGASSALLGSEQLDVDGVLFDLPTLRGAANLSSYELTLCWTGASDRGAVQQCTHTGASDPHQLIAEKSLVNYGPIRHVYARPFCIVFGTPQSHALRVALRNFAVYLGNAHAAAYRTHVRVLSDLEYQTSRQASRAQLSNIIFVGGPSMNKAMAAMCGDGVRAPPPPATDGSPQLIGRLPQGVKFSAEINSATGRSHDYKFELDSTAFAAPDQSVIFALPFYRPDPISARRAAPKAPVTGTVAMAVCIHANSALGYLHLSRLAWPVVPPMVRAPFATYMPDFTVIDGALWSLGMGSVLKAGYWDNEWKAAADQTFTNTFPF